MSRELPLILIADDEPDILSVYKTKLERSGFKVLTAPNGKEAVEIAAKEKPDLVLMDMKMPVMDGVTAEQELQTNSETKDIKVVFLTAFSDPTQPDIDKTVAKQAGALDYLKKGISLDELVEKVRGYIAR